MQSTTTQSMDKETRKIEPWQLKMFRRSLKKQQKLSVLLDILGPLQDQKCLLITCGDNNGALNWHFKRYGGQWAWADAEHDSLAQIAELTGDGVMEFSKESPSLAFPDNSFDVVMTIDVHEHIENPGAVNNELFRIVKTGGRVIVTTPGGNRKKLANRIKASVGMRKEDYGHVVDGYDAPQLEQQLEQSGLKPYMRTSYSRFFTEMIELMINLAYVKLLSKKKKAEVSAGQIAPQNEDQIKSVEKTYKFYAALYPFFRAISLLDSLIQFSQGYAAVVAARKE